MPPCLWKYHHGIPFCIVTIEVFSSHSAANRVEISSAGDERDVFACCRQPPADISADRTRTNNCDLHARIRNGFKTNTASSAAARFMIAAATNTPRHPAEEAPIKLLSGTRRDATPFATYSNPEFAEANF